MLWVYDLRGLDLAEWARRAPAELAVTAQPGDRVMMLVEDQATGEPLASALRRAGHAPAWTESDGLPCLLLQYGEAPAAAAEPNAG